MDGDPIYAIFYSSVRIVKRCGHRFHCSVSIKSHINKLVDVALIFWPCCKCSLALLCWLLFFLLSLYRTFLFNFFLNLCFLSFLLWVGEHDYKEISLFHSKSLDALSIDSILAFVDNFL